MAKGSPLAKNNDRLWHCTNDDARGTIFVKGNERRSASTWPVPASASAVVATFTSSLDATVRLFWRNPDTGEEVPYGEVTGRDALRRGGPGDGLQLRTHPGHTFRVYRGDELVRSFTVTAPRGGNEAFHLR